MKDDIAFPPGDAGVQSGPLERFLPPLESGNVLSILEESGEAGELVVDPFGASPQLILETAQADRGVIVAANNPITRYMIHHFLAPFSRSILQAALARLATTPKDESRMEPFILDLYRTICSNCGASVSADYFVWNKGEEEPILKAYTCGTCGQAVEEVTNEVDRGRARSYSQRGLHFAMALEELAPAHDPYRDHAETALSAYSGRSIYALITMISKLSQFDLEEELFSPIRALLLYAFDACNALWGYPEGRLHPRRLSLSSQFKEMNVWQAMEDAVKAWSFGHTAIPVTRWPDDGIPEAGTVAIFPGSARMLPDTLDDIHPQMLLTVFPRPNQAYWTLTALWASWLWGREASSSIKAALRRRRYDWNWHARALLAVLSSMGEHLDEGTLTYTFIPAAEPGFTAAAVTGMDRAGFQLTGRAFRMAETQGLLRWRIDRTKPSAKPQSDYDDHMLQSAKEVLEVRGEPAPFSVLHAAAWTGLAEKRMLISVWDSESRSPLTELGNRFESQLMDRRVFQHLGRGSDPEHGLYWLTDPRYADEPLYDRVEWVVLELLRAEGSLTEEVLFRHVYHHLPGLLTPDRRLVERCLQSYAELEVQSGLWFLRPEDQLEARERDRAEIEELLFGLGERIGFNVGEDVQVTWRDDRGEEIYRFYIQDTATLGSALAEETRPLTIVLPGSRSFLVMEKARRDPRLNDWLKGAPRIIKYRHVRRLVAETTLNLETLHQRLTIDPPEHQDPQLPLL
ncbi:MAG: hypothetical protein GTO18_16290 [Anaerolineales bacterium]|nr:hypothetical protein [Anaerolineales bacterium]